MSTKEKLRKLSQLAQEISREICAADFLESEHNRDSNGRFARTKTETEKKLAYLQQKLGLKIPNDVNPIEKNLAELKLIAPSILAGLAALSVGTVAARAARKKGASGAKVSSPPKPADGIDLSGLEELRRQAAEGAKAAEAARAARRKISIHKVPSAVSAGSVDRDKILLSTRGFDWGFKFPIKPKGVDVPTKNDEPVDWLKTYEAATSRRTVETTTVTGTVKTTYGTVVVGNKGANVKMLSVEFPDPLGRMDQSNRIIPHSVILFGDQVDSLEDLEPVDLVSKVWNEIADEYAAIYKKK